MPLAFLLCGLAFPQKKPNIAVVELEGNGVAGTDLGGLSNRLRSELFKTGNFTVIERGQMDLILKEQEFQMMGCTTQECVVEIGQLLGVRFIIAGSIDKVGKLFSADIRMVNVETGEIEKSVTADCEDCGLEDVMRVIIHNAARKLAGLPPDKIIPRLTAASLAAGFGYVFVTSSPPGALIYIDGMLQEGKMTPASLHEIPAGDRVIKLIKGNLIGIRKVAVIKNDLLKIDIPLKPGKGHLKLFSKPVGAAVFFDGKKLGEAPLMHRDLSAGKHEVACKMEGYLPFSKTISIETHKTLKFTCALEKGTGLRVHAYGENKSDTLRAGVFLNSQRLGETPLSTRIPYGKYALRLSLKDYGDAEKFFDTEKKDELSFALQMKHTAEYFQRMKQERKRREELTRQRAEKWKKMKKTAIFSGKIISGIASLALGGLSYYYYNQSQKETKQANAIMEKYEHSDSGFEAHKADFIQKKNDSEESEKSGNLFLGAAGGCALFFGISFTF